MSEKEPVVCYEQNSFLNEQGESRSKEAGREEMPANPSGQQHGKKGVGHQAREHL